MMPKRRGGKTRNKEGTPVLYALSVALAAFGLLFSAGAIRTAQLMPELSVTGTQISGSGPDILCNCVSSVTLVNGGEETESQIAFTIGKISGIHGLEAQARECRRLYGGACSAAAEKHVEEVSSLYSASATNPVNYVYSSG